MYCAERCPCCASKELQSWPAIVSPFLASYACQTAPDLCQLCECRQCTFRFFDSRLTDEEVQRLYSGYRGDQYFKARHGFEFWYSRAVNDGIGSDETEIAARKRNLARFLGDRASAIDTVLDYGGDRGQFIPENVGKNRFVYELSDAKPAPDVTRLNSVAGRTFDLIMLAHVLEHCSEPLQMIQLLQPLGHANTLFYFEVPYERPSLAWTGSGAIQRLYLRALLHARPLLTLADLYSTVARVKFDFVPPFGLQKCSEHLNFFSKPSLQVLLESAGLELIDSGIAAVAACGPVSRILYGLARLAPE